MALSIVSSLQKPLLQSSESITQEPTTLTIECGCETETEQSGKEESDSGEQEKTTHNPGVGTGPKTNEQGKENATVEDNTQTENTPCTCEGGNEEVVEENDSGKQRITPHNPGVGTGPKTNGQGIENAIVEDNTQTENTPCPCEGVIEEVTEESDSGKQRITPHNPGVGTGPQTNGQGIKNAIVEDNTQTENTPSKTTLHIWLFLFTCEGVTEEVTEESDSGKQEKTAHDPGVGTGPKTNEQGKENATVEG